VWLTPDAPLAFLLCRTNAFAPKFRFAPNCDPGVDGRENPTEDDPPGVDGRDC
jgi:hypothetical protein